MDAPIRKKETSHLIPSEEVAQAEEFSSEKLPSIEDTLQMARLANMVYTEKPITAFKDAATKSKASKDPKAAYIDHLVAEGGAGTEMWYYECDKQGTEAILTFSPKNNRCTVIFRGTETSGVAAWKDIKSDLSGLKKPFGTKPLKPLGPNREEDDHPEGCRVHQGFRNQYYGEVSEFRNDGAVDEDLLAEKGTIEGMVLETALLQKVRRCI